MAPGAAELIFQRSFSEAVLVSLGPTGLRASGTVSFLGAVWVPVIHD